MDRPTISWAESSPEDAAQMVAPSGTENCGSTCVAASSDSEVEVHAVAYDKSISDVTKVKTCHSENNQNEDQEAISKVHDLAEQHAFSFPDSFETFNRDYLCRDSRWKYYTEDSYWRIAGQTSISRASKGSASLPVEPSPEEFEIAWPSPEQLEAISQPAVTFTPFSKLPTELRLKIWRFALPSPRIVHISSDFQSNIQRDVAHHPGRQHLYTCTESMDVFQRHFQRLLVEGPISCLGYRSSLRFTMDYIDYERDTLSLDIVDIQHWIWQGLWLNLSAVRYLALICYNSHYRRVDQSSYNTVEILCPKLRTFHSTLKECGMPLHDDSLMLIPINYESMYADPVYTLDSRENRVLDTREWQEMIAKAGERRDDFHSDWSQDWNYWRSVDFSVSVPAVKHVGNPARDEQKLWLEPKVGLPWDTAFYVWRPALQDDKDENYHI